MLRMGVVGLALPPVANREVSLLGEGCLHACIALATPTAPVTSLLDGSEAAMAQMVLTWTQRLPVAKK